jgi:hypothetical protein
MRAAIAALEAINATIHLRSSGLRSVLSVLTFFAHKLVANLNIFRFELPVGVASPIDCDLDPWKSFNIRLADPKAQIAGKKKKKNNDSYLDFSYIIGDPEYA